MSGACQQTQHGPLAAPRAPPGTPRQGGTSNKYHGYTPLSPHCAAAERSHTQNFAKSEGKMTHTTYTHGNSTSAHCCIALKKRPLRKRGRPGGSAGALRKNQPGGLAPAPPSQRAHCIRLGDKMIRGVAALRTSIAHTHTKNSRHLASLPLLPKQPGGTLQGNRGGRRSWTGPLRPPGPRRTPGRGGEALKMGWLTEE